MDPLLTKILENTLNGVVVCRRIVDENHRIVDFEYVIVNRKASLLLGISSSEIVGRRMSEVYLPNKTDGMLDLYIYTMETGEKSEKEIHYKSHQQKQWFRIESAKMDEEMVLICFEDITHYKEAESKIAHREALLKETQHLARVGTYEWCAEDQELYWSDELYRIYGYQPGEVLLSQEFIMSHIHPDERIGFEKKAKEYLSELPRQVEHFLKILRKDGSEGVLFGISNTHKDQFGNLTRITGYMQDISERVKIENESQKYLELLNESQRVAQIGSFENNIEKDEIHCSREFRRILGFEENKKLRFEDVLTRIHPEDRDRVSKHLEEVIRNNDPYNIRYRVVLPDGTEKYIWSRAKVYYDQDGKIWKSIGTITDITRLKMVEEQLRKSREFLYLSQEIAQVGSFEYDVAANRLTGSPELYRLFGYNASEIVTYEALEERIHPDDRKYAFQAMRDAFDKHQPYDIEYRIIISDGLVRYMWTKGKVFYDEKDIAYRMIGTTMDITERKLGREKLKRLNSELEARVDERTEELIQKNEDLTRINRDLDSFVYHASHDLKAPIHNIEALLTTLSDELSPDSRERVEGILEMLDHSIHAVKDTITDLASIGKAQVGGNVISHLHFQEMLEEVKLSLFEEIENSHAVILGDFDKVPSIRFSRKHLRSILQNLISNAIRYRSPERAPEIRVVTENAEGHVLLKVSDNGLGIKEEDKSKVFGMYQRLHQHIEGTGIGMTIVARIVDDNGGRIEIDSREGVGSTFNIYLKPAEEEGEMILPALIK